MCKHRGFVLRREKRRGGMFMTSKKERSNT